MTRFLLAALAALLLPALAQAQCFPTPSCQIVPPPTAQAIAAGETIKANACGTVKRVTASTAVTTSTTDTFTAPEGGNVGCMMFVCNTSSGANNITLDNNGRFLSNSGGNVVLTQNDCVGVMSLGDTWIQLTPLEAN